MVIRFDDYLRQRGIAVEPVDGFDGFEVDVDGPQDWAAVESPAGMRIWVWPEDPFRNEFCANAVLTMHRVAERLDPAEVFSMLCDEQVQLVRGCHERYRAWKPADDGIGIQGMLSSQFDSEFGPIGSASQTRVITDPQQTLIAQLTVTALLSSPACWADIRVSVAPARTDPTNDDAAASPGPGSDR